MQIIFGLFPNAAQAQAAVQALLADHTTLQAANIGIVSKSPDGQISFLETAEQRELRRLSTLGRVTGWLLGLAGAVVGAPFTIWQSTTTGDVVATELAIRHDAGFPDEALRHLGEHLHAGSAAVLILTDREASEPIRAALEQFGGTVYQGALPPKLEAELTPSPATDYHHPPPV
jgi:uncharacterized membrane protein